MIQGVLNYILAGILTAGKNPPAELLPFNYSNKEQSRKHENLNRKSKFKVKREIIRYSKVNLALPCTTEENHIYYFPTLSKENRS